MKFLKPLTLIILAFLAIAPPLKAQVDLKVSPFGLLFSNIVLRAEFPVAEAVGIELQGGAGWNKINFDEEDDLKTSTLRFGANGRYYFSPEVGLDKFYLGAYARFAAGKGSSTADTDEYNTTRFSVGTLFGYKVLAKNQKLLFDFNLGFGRALIYKFDPIGDTADNVDLSDIPLLNWDIPATIAIGYRF